VVTLGILSLFDHLSDFTAKLYNVETFSPKLNGGARKCRLIVQDAEKR
jgi:hypothetical protein